LLAARAVAPLTSRLLLMLPAFGTLALAVVVDAYVFRHARGFELTAALAAIGFALIAVWLRPARAEDASSTPLRFAGELYAVDSYGAAVCAGVLSLALASAAAIEPPWLLVALAALAAAAILLRAPAGTELLRPVGHAFFALLGIAFAMLADRFADARAFDSDAIAFAIVAAAAAITTARLARSDERLVYWLGVYFMVHVLLATELVAVRSAPWLASVAYALVGSALLIGGSMKGRITIQRAGMVSLALLVARLMIYDLANVDLGVRIVLFMACGFGFLGLSYYIGRGFRMR
ncbi:MAG: hypothetical protein ACT443_04870, partial [Gemmatimonadota bacterium]